MSCSSLRRPRLRADRGFTLVELLVALVISGILAGVLFQLFQGQGRMARMQSSREEVQQNSRAVAELISSELRAVPPTAIVEAARNRITYNLPRVWGLTCSAAVGGAATLSVVLPPDAMPSLPANADLPGRWGIAVESATTPGSFITSPLNGTATPAADCATRLNLAATSPADRRGFAVSFPGGTNLPAGARVFLYEQVRYDVRSAAGTGGSGVWIYRNDQPLAGPLPVAAGAATSTEGLALSYSCPGKAYTDAQLADANVRAALRQVQLRVIAESREVRADQRLLDTAAVAVHLRNSPPGAVVCP